MPDDGEQRPREPPEERPQGAPDYKVYRSKRGIFSRLKGRDVPKSDDAGAAGGAGSGGGGVPGAPELPDEPGRRNYGPGHREGRHLPEIKMPWKRRDRGARGGRRKPPARRIAFWVGIAIVGWIVVSLLSFAISSQLQSFKLAGEAKDALHGNPFILPSAQNILVMGTDARPVSTKERGADGESAAPKQKCFEQQEKGEAPHSPCGDGEFRADTLMVVRAGGGTFNKLSIPRDSFAEIPGEQPQKINAAFAFGGAALQIKTVEKFLNIKIDHVAIIDFTGLENLVDSVGGVEVNLPHKLCAEIAGGSGHGQGGITLHLKKGENTLDGEQALAYSRIREPSECPGKGKSAYSYGYSDLNRAQAQQAVINGIKGRLTSISRIPYNFIKGPIIGWDAPKAFVSDMGFFTMPQLVLAAAIGGTGGTDVLCGTPKEAAKCGIGTGPEGSIEIPKSVRRAAVKRLMG
ncbi:MAG TPA: LCP family protein [Solirubrobacterales bacterium]|nr:LCP family protein [Solirubrobacterales bacterium]